MLRKKQHILWYKETTNKDVSLVGGKNASLGEMYRELTAKGVNIPNGFAITAEAYRYFIKSAGIDKQIKKILKDLKKDDIRDLNSRAKQVRDMIKNSKMPKDLEKKIYSAYEKLGNQYGLKRIDDKKGLDVAVRSSATAEDLPDASFAGQQETYLNVVGRIELLEAVKNCFASLFTDRAIVYRQEKKFDHFKVFLSVGVQKMVRSDLASSGVMFSIDTESGFKDVVLINSIYGLGENIVQGKVNPDEFYVFKPTLKQNKQAIIYRSLGDKKIKMIYAGMDVKNVPVKEADRQRFSISDKQVLELAQWAVQISEHYNKPMDMEWALDGKTKKLFIVQARPETVQAQRNEGELEEYVLKTSVAKKAKILAVGKSVGSKIGQGEAHVILNVKDINNFKEGAVLVTEMTDPDWVPIMKKARAIVTNSGGRTCHAAIVSRELGIPCVVGTGNATKKIKNKEFVTVSCSEGEVGKVYQGNVPFEVHKIDLKKISKTKTKIMLNVGEPDRAFEFSFLPNDGVGLAREEFIINNFIKIHPLALLNFNKLKDKKAKTEIFRLTLGYTKKSDFFVEKLAEGVAMIGAAFYPKDVIVRLSDFKSDEYANLIGGREFEPHEDNPMLGWRGASRYYDDKYRAAFELECEALRVVRDKMGLTNVKVMVPFCRTVEEGKRVQEIMAAKGLKRGKNGLEVYVMCEIPSNVILAEKFAEIFDGFSIGSNDLTMLVLGLDRNSSMVAKVADERDEAVKEMISQVISIAKAKKRKIGICGQAPSDFPDFAQFLVSQGIDSISLTPDSVIRTLPKVAEIEKK